MIEKTTFAALGGTVSAAVLALLPVAAGATPIPAAFTVPAVILAGEEVAIGFSHAASAPASWTHSSATAVFQLDGEAVESFWLAPSGGTTTLLLTLPEPGSHELRAVGSIQYFRSEQVVVGWRPITRPCGWFSTCTVGHDPIYEWRTVSLGTRTIDTSVTLTVQPAIAPVPVPAALPLLAGALALLGLAGRRRRQPA